MFEELAKQLKTDLQQNEYVTIELYANDINILDITGINSWRYNNDKFTLMDATGNIIGIIRNQDSIVEVVKTGMRNIDIYMEV
ncbi:MAG: hypothetical protein ACRDD7_09435 [Peptostreptococcaceae bacterium]